MKPEEEKKKGFDFDNANLADQITVVGFIEHGYDHCCKAAASSSKEDAIFYMTVADMLQSFRRRFMKEHFPNVKETDWCLLKATEQIRQRVYESAHTSYKDLKEANDIWAVVMEHIFGIDMSSCIQCKEDKETPQE